MAQEFFITKKRTGRPPGKTRPPTKPVQVPLETLDRVDDWIGNHPEPRPTRPEAIRRLVEKGLVDMPAMPASDVSLDQQIAEQKAVIAEIPEPEGPSPEAALATMDKALAENELVEMKNEKTRRKKAARKT